MTNTYPKNFARFYDVIYNQIRNTVDHDFFLNQIKQTRGKVLEIGVGTGRFIFRYELEHLVERSKIKQYTILGDYLGNTLNETSKEFIIICKRK